MLLIDSCSDESGDDCDPGRAAVSDVESGGVLLTVRGRYFQVGGPEPGRDFKVVVGNVECLNDGVAVLIAGYPNDMAEAVGWQVSPIQSIDVVQCFLPLSAEGGGEWGVTAPVTACVWLCVSTNTITRGVS